MWDDCIPPSLDFKEQSYELEMKSPFHGGTLLKELEEDSSPFSHIFTSDMLLESNIAFNTTGQEENLVQDNDASSEAIQLNFCDNLKSAELGNNVPQQVFVCQFCTFSTQNRKTFMVHKRKHAGVKSFSCEMCSAKFTRNYSLQKHLRQKHSPHGSTTAMPKYCPFSSCNYVTRNPNALQVHRRTQHTNVYYCKQCNARYPLRRSLLHHLTSIHGSNVSLIGINTVQEESASDGTIEVSTETVSNAEKVNGGAETPVMENTVTTEYRCEKCGFNASTLRGLYHHKRFKHATKKRSQTGTQNSRKRAVAQRNCDSPRTNGEASLLEKVGAPVGQTHFLPRTRSSTRNGSQSNSTNSQSTRQNDYVRTELVDQCSYIYVPKENNLNEHCEDMRNRRMDYNRFALNGQMMDGIASNSSGKQSPISDCFPVVSSVGWTATSNETALASPQPSRCGKLDGSESQLAEMSSLNDAMEFNESADLTACVSYLQETNTRILNLYRRKRYELQNLRRLATEFFHRMLPEHPITRNLHAWKNIDHALEHVLNAQNPP